MAVCALATPAIQKCATQTTAPWIAYWATGKNGASAPSLVAQANLSGIALKLPRQNMMESPAKTPNLRPATATRTLALGTANGVTGQAGASAPGRAARALKKAREQRKDWHRMPVRIVRVTTQRRSTATYITARTIANGAHGTNGQHARRLVMAAKGSGAAIKQEKLHPEASCVRALRKKMKNATLWAARSIANGGHGVPGVSAPRRAVVARRTELGSRPRNQPTMVPIAQEMRQRRKSAVQMVARLTAYGANGKDGLLVPRIVVEVRKQIEGKRSNMQSSTAKPVKAVERKPKLATRKVVLRTVSMEIGVLGQTAPKHAARAY